MLTKKTKNKKKIDNGLEKYVDIDYINGENALFYRKKGGLLALKYGDQEYSRVTLHRAFPFNLEDRYISVFDPEGKEIGIIKSLEVLSDEMRSLLEEELKWTYFCPQIEKIEKLAEEFGYWYWEVTTDAGKKRFTVKGTDSLIPISETRLIINDVEGNRFEIKDINNLDESSLRLLEKVI